MSRLWVTQGVMMKLSDDGKMRDRDRLTWGKEMDIRKVVEEKEERER